MKIGPKFEIPGWKLSPFVQASNWLPLPHIKSTITGSTTPNWNHDDKEIRLQRRPFQGNITSHLKDYNNCYRSKDEMALDNIDWASDTLIFCMHPFWRRAISSRQRRAFHWLLSEFAKQMSFSGPRLCWGRQMMRKGQITDNLASLKRKLRGQSTQTKIWKWLTLRHFKHRSRLNCASSK